MQRESRLYLVMMACFSLATALSNMFISVFLWKLQSSLTLLAEYSLIYSVVVVVSFPLCGILARRRTPMTSLRLGILGMIATYGLVLWYREASAAHIALIGFGMGLSSGLFAIGMHMQTLDSTEDRGRDRFLYVSALLNSAGGMAAPLVSGSLIHHFEGMLGYYLVFGLSVVWFLLAAVISFQLKGQQVAKTSHLREVWKQPTREWRGMYWVTIGSAIVEGTYSTFLVTIFGYVILKNELSLGGFATLAAVIGLLTSLVLAKVSTPQKRFVIFAIGAVLLSASSILLSVWPTFAALVVYTVVSNVGMSMITTTFNAWTYASIERDPDYANRRLDYIVVREIPLGIGRTIGIAFFLLLQVSLDVQTILPVSFACFGTVFLLLLPLVRRIWRPASSFLPHEKRLPL